MSEDRWTELGPCEVTMDGRTQMASSFKIGPVCEFSWEDWKAASVDNVAPPIVDRGHPVAFYYACNVCDDTHWCVPVWEARGTSYADFTETAARMHHLPVPVDTRKPGHPTAG